MYQEENDKQCISIARERSVIRAVDFSADFVSSRFRRDEPGPYRRLLHSFTSGESDRVIEWREFRRTK